MSNVLTVEQREQAGSDSYNRFEYQVHWIVCHIIDKLHEDAECIVFCEFNDEGIFSSEISKKTFGNYLKKTLNLVSRTERKNGKPQKWYSKKL